MVEEKIQRLQEKKKQWQKLCTQYPELSQNAWEWGRIELTYTSNNLEGNTLTRQETKCIIDDQISIGGKHIYEILEAKNHGKAIEYIQAFLEKYSIHKWTEKNIILLHQTILQGIDDQYAGRYRNFPVRVSGSMTIFPNFQKVPDLMSELADWIQNSNDENFIEKSLEVHLRLVSIHPFQDGNGRTARLLLNLFLLADGFPLISIHPQYRAKYLASLETAQIQNEELGYKLCMLEAMEYSLDQYLQLFDKSKNIDTDTFFTLGKLAEHTGVSISTLRHWMSLNILFPVKIGKNKYVYFNTQSIVEVQQIIFLQKEKKYSLKEIKNII